MSASLNRLDRCNQILALMRAEHIATSEKGTEEEKKYTTRMINVYRDYIRKLDVPPDLPKGLTSCVAITLLKVGGCLEHMQRFALEFLSGDQEDDVNLIFTSNLNNPEYDNHCFGIVGRVKAKEGLIVGKGNGPATIAYEKFYIPLEQFLAEQPKENVVVDPFFDCVSESDEKYLSQVSFFKERHITHVVAVRTYSHSISLQLLQRIKEAAVAIAEYTKKLESKAPAKLEYLKTSAALIKVLEKSGLDPEKKDSQEVRQQAFRRMAGWGTPIDLHVLFQTGIDINAQDINPKKKNTALHIAYAEKNQDNIKFLLSKKCRTDITNAQGITADQLKIKFEEDLQNA